MTTSEPSLTMLLLRDPEHPTVRELLLRQRARLLMELADIERVLGMERTRPAKRDGERCRDGERAAS